MTKEYKQYLIASAKYEIHQLKESGEEFVISKRKFNAGFHETCFYGQKFGSSFNDKSSAFKQKNLIRNNFQTYSLVAPLKEKATALEILLCRKWDENQKEECIQILSEFCTFKEDEEQKDLDKLLDF